jgi:hypothetical protein
MMRRLGITLVERIPAPFSTDIAIAFFGTQQGDFSLTIGSITAKAADTSHLRKCISEQFQPRYEKHQKLALGRPKMGPWQIARNITGCKEPRLPFFGLSENGRSCDFENSLAQTDFTHWLPDWWISRHTVAVAKVAPSLMGREYVS